MALHRLVMAMGRRRRQEAATMASAFDYRVQCTSAYSTHTGSRALSDRVTRRASSLLS